MGLEWLWQGVVSSWVAAALACAGGAVLGYLYHRRHSWATSILYGLAGSASIAVLLWTFTGNVPLFKQQPQTTIKNVETNVRTWIDKFGLTVQREINPEAHFVFTVTLPNNIKVSVRRPKELDRYIIFQSRLNISSEDQLILKNLSKEQTTRLIAELILEMARLNIEWDVRGEPLNSILLRKLVPITSGLNEDAFADRLHSMGNALILLHQRLILTFPPQPLISINVVTSHFPSVVLCNFHFP
jgi:hypothetical protein